jgi:(S)-2-hydroxyglutarate dehydrogenase
MKYDVIVIGGGIVGLTTAYELININTQLKIALIEKEHDVAQHQTGHNSGVIHSGLYYKPGSLKAKNCIDGYNMLLDFCNQNEIKYELCGKLVVAVDQSEVAELDKLYKRGIENGLVRNKIISESEIIEYEPHLKGIKAIHVPYTGIINYTQVSLKLKQLLLNKGVELFFNSKVVDIINGTSRVELVTESSKFETRFFVNCAGLYSDKVASFTNKDIDTRIIPFRGEYFMLKPEKQGIVKNLIYPVPDPSFPFLGVHFTRMIEGGVEAGPNAVFAFKREGYKKSDINFKETLESLMWPGFRKVARKYWKTGMGEFYRSYSKTAFTRALQRLIPEINEDDLIPAEAGVRAQACDKYGGLLDDFKIIEEKLAIHVLNAPSPAATSSFSIGRFLAQKVNNKL